MPHIDHDGLSLQSVPSLVPYKFELEHEVEQDCKETDKANDIHH